MYVYIYVYVHAYICISILCIRKWQLASFHTYGPQRTSLPQEYMCMCICMCTHTYISVRHLSTTISNGLHVFLRMVAGGCVACAVCVLICSRCFRHDISIEIFISNLKTRPISRVHSQIPLCIMP